MSCYLDPIVHIKTSSSNSCSREGSCPLLGKDLLVGHIQGHVEALLPTALEVQCLREAMLGARAHFDLYLVHQVAFIDLWWNYVLGDKSLDASLAFQCICWTLVALNAAKEGKDAVLDDSFTLLCSENYTESESQACLICFCF